METEREIKERLEHYRIHQRNYNKQNKDKLRDSVKRWAQNNPEKRWAHEKVKDALRSGRLVKTPCEVCGEKRVDGHHKDYSKVLEVMWLCPLHHREQHKKEKAIQRFTFIN